MTTAVALYRAGAGRVVVAAAVLSIVFGAHEAPAAIGLLGLTVAGVLRERERTKPALGTPGRANAGGG